MANKIFAFFFMIGFLPAAVFAQEFNDAGEFWADSDLLEDEFIDITEAFHGRLALRLEFSESLNVPEGFAEDFRKNLLWTGVFDVTEDERTTGSALILQNSIFGGVKLTLSADGLPIHEGLMKFSRSRSDNEGEIVAAIDELVISLTGKKSSLDSAVLFVEAEEGRSGKNIVIASPSGANRKVLVADGNLNFFPTFSPSGKAFIYTRLSRTDSRIIRVDFETGAETTLAHYRGVSTGGDWLDDRHIVTAISSRGNSDLYHLNASNGKILKKLVSWGSTESSPSISPDGEIAFISDRSGTVQIYALDGVDDRRPSRLTFFSNYSSEPEFSNDGGHIIFSANTGGARFQLFVMDRKGGSIQKISQEPFGAEQPQWSPDDRLVIFTRDHRNKGTGLYIMTLDGKYKRRLQTGKAGASHSQADWIGHFNWQSLP